MNERRQHVVLGVTGGIAAYKAVEICRRLVDAGVYVAPVMTKSATRFVGEVTFSALASEPVQTSLWDETSPIPHTRLGQEADLVIVAPATADLLAKYAAGLADDLLTATLLATRATVMVCPAMHTEMWEHPAVQENLATLRKRGVVIVPPEDGRLAGGDAGPGRLAAPESIVSLALDLLQGAGNSSQRGSDLCGIEIVVSVGGTREPIDPVRYLTNRSSGRQGHALAAQAARRGASVTLVTTQPRSAPTNARITVVPVDTAEEMTDVMGAAALGSNVVIMAAAVADFRPKAPAKKKISKSDGLPDMVFERTPDILSSISKMRRPDQVIVGFAAETHDVVSHAEEKLGRKGLDMIVANDVTAPGAGFDHATNAVTILVRGTAPMVVPLSTKEAVADAVLDRVVDLLADLGAPGELRRDAL